MTRYYCHYCDAHLTHDSPVVRRQHNDGFKHKANVRAYYTIIADVNGLAPAAPVGGTPFGAPRPFYARPPPGGWRPRGFFGGPPRPWGGPPPPWGGPQPGPPGVGGGPPGVGGGPPFGGMPLPPGVPPPQ